MALANCAAMNIPPSEARALSYYEYQAILWNWNESHSFREDEAPDGDWTAKLVDAINADPRLTGPTPELVN